MPRMTKFMHFSSLIPSLTAPLAVTLLLATETVAPAGAQGTGPVQDVMAIYLKAQENDPRYLAAEANYRAEAQKLPQARGALLPALSASGEKTRVDTERITDSTAVSLPPGKADFDSGSYSLSLTQPIFNAALFAALKQAKAEVRRAEAERLAAKQDLIIRTAEAYLRVLAARDNLDLAIAERKAIARQLEVAQGRLEVGLATITDVHDAQARFDLAQVQEIEATDQLADTHEALREMTGEPVGQLARLRDTMPLLKPDPPNVEKWVATALAQNLTLMARREDTAIARAQVGANRAQHFPTLDLVGSQSRDDADASLSGPGARTDTTSVELRLTVPIYQGGTVSAQVTEAVERFKAAQHELDAELRATERATRTAYLGVSSGTARVRALRQAVTASESALEAKIEGFEAGINPNLDVLDAQRDLFRTKRDHSVARHTYIFSLLRLKQAAGTLGSEDLVEVNGWLDSSGAAAVDAAGARKPAP